MKWNPVKDAKKGRGPFYFTIEDNIVRLWLGDPIEPDREFIIQVHVEYIPDIIATLRMVEQKKSS